MLKGRFGPGFVIAAAFIGPGTVTTCSLAGADFGYSLLWAILFAVFTAIILQEMSARLGFISRKGLGQIIREEFQNKFLRYGSVILIVAAIGFGCAAFEAGNLIGGALGLESIAGLSRSIWALLITLVAFVLLWRGSYAVVEKFLVGLVFIMSLAFIATMVIVRPQISYILKGLFFPRLPGNSYYFVIALIGTTVVPYNLFLHSSIAHKKWAGHQGLKFLRQDIFLAIPIGGLISCAIIITASAAFFGQGIEIKNAGTMAIQLEPFLGKAAKIFFAIGLFAAGMSSSITAPYAAAYATSGALGWEENVKGFRFRIVWLIVLLSGTLISLLKIRPIAAIIFAQAANGVLLPIIAVFLLIVMNNKKLLADKVNRLWQNVLGWVVVLIAIGLGLVNILKAFKVIR
jgi:Mn2+/Fe2+ NRAMP family transporter